MRGLFATHLHRIIDDIADDIIDVPRTSMVQMSMGTRVVRTDELGYEVQAPTWKLQEGYR